MSSLWKAKLAAWIHDPAEKALVLMRDPGVGHEEGSVARLRSQLRLTDFPLDRRADWLAAGADRPVWPGDATKQHWTRINFGKQPFLVHPLSGKPISLHSLNEVEASEVRTASFEHFSRLIELAPGGEIDYRLTHLAFWRFGAETTLSGCESIQKLGSLWNLLPADTRIPDGSIWEHLNLVSALAGALYEDTPALLTMSIGPVQGFLAQARSTSDLWAGSHILSSVVWEGLRVLCEELGPDSILFPNLLGVSLVDQWILEQIPDGGHRAAWTERFKAINPDLFRKTDENSLYAAALPNKYVAIVPRARAEILGRKAIEAMRTAASRWTLQAAEALFVGCADDTMKAQIAEQIADFPEAHWSISPWPVPAAGKGSRIEDEQIAPLRDAEAAFLPKGSKKGFFSEKRWTAREEIVEAGGVQWYSPGAGSLYPLVYRIGDKAHAAAKQLRPFQQLVQGGFRCSICGEREWLRSDKDPVDSPPGGGKDNRTTVWSGVHGKQGVKKGERLCALCTLKRVWPEIFGKRVTALLDGDPRRFVVSTHAMSLATGIDKASRSLDDKLRAQLNQYSCQIDALRADALPRSVISSLNRIPLEDGRLLRAIPAILDRLREENRLEEAEKLRTILGGETYYALLLMDGDRMGAWLAAQEPDKDEPELRMPLEKVLHPEIAAGVRNYAPSKEVDEFLKIPRPASPSRHAAISSALNHFAGTVARQVVERSCRGRLIYAGGDDVLAMLPVEDLLDAIGWLRSAYSGEAIPGINLPKNFRIDGGFWQAQTERRGAWTPNGPLLRMMGTRATASFGAVIAHHQTPLALVLRRLREAEQDAKGNGRNAFAIRTMKRSGGETTFVAGFQPLGSSNISPFTVLNRFRGWLGANGVSRRAVYHSLRWLRELPEIDPGQWRALVGTNLAAQLLRQCSSESSDMTRELVPSLAGDLVDATASSSDRSDALQSMLVTAEFLARETRQSDIEPTEGDL